MDMSIIFVFITCCVLILQFKNNQFCFNLYCSPAVYSFVLLKWCADFAFCVCLNTSVFVSITVFLIGFIATCIHWCFVYCVISRPLSSTVVRILRLYVCLSCYMANVIRRVLFLSLCAVQTHFCNL